MSPQEYLLLKEFLIRESMKTGFISRDFVDNNIKIGKTHHKYDYLLFKLEKERISGVFDFLVSNNTIIEKK